MTIDSLRQQHSALVFEAFNYQLIDDQLQIKFDFLLKPDIKFEPQVIINNVNADVLNKIPRENLDNLVFNLGLAELPSYWKAACPQEIIIKAGYLNSKQIAWWKKLFIKGLGEFYYVNQIDFTQEDFIKFTVDDSAPRLDESSEPMAKEHYSQQFLIAVGGGKDSGFTLGLFDQNQLEFSTLVLEPTTPASAQIIAQTSPKHQITAVRTIDPQLIKLNQQGYLNGHIPYNAYFAFFSQVIAHLFGFQQILISNESSANQGNLEYQGLNINHQYSKSYEFEQDFRQYSYKYLQAADKQAEYLSFLRPINELQIARVFSSMHSMLPVFKSCNVGQKENIWCEHCSKCLFVFMMLYPFIDESVLTQEIFSHNLFADESLLELALQLTDKNKDKPLDCVGTDQEAVIACYLSIKKLEQNSQPLPYLLKQIQEQVLVNFSQEQLEKLATITLQNWNKNHNLDQQLSSLLQKVVLQ